METTKYTFSGNYAIQYFHRSRIRFGIKANDEAARVNGQDQPSHVSFSRNRFRFACEHSGHLEQDVATLKETNETILECRVSGVTRDDFLVFLVPLEMKAMKSGSVF